MLQGILLEQLCYGFAALDILFLSVNPSAALKNKKTPGGSDPAVARVQRSKQTGCSRKFRKCATFAYDALPPFHQCHRSATVACLWSNSFGFLGCFASKTESCSFLERKPQSEDHLLPTVILSHSPGKGGAPSWDMKTCTGVLRARWDRGRLLHFFFFLTVFTSSSLFFWSLQLLQQLKKLICDLCRLYNLPQHPDVEMLDQPLPAGPVGQDRKASVRRGTRRS